MIRKTLVITIVALSCVLGHAQTYQPIVYQHPTFNNGSGLPCAGCSLYSYAAGSTTPQATFSDCTSGTQNTNPVILGTDGGANICINNLSYKFVLTDTGGNLVWSADNVSGWLGSLGNYLPLAGGTLTGTLNGTNASLSGTLGVSGATTLASTMVTKLNTIIYADQQAGSTADVKIATACSALPSAGGTIDARGFGATTQSIAAQISCGSATKPVTILFDPATLFQATTNAINVWKVQPRNYIQGFTFDCGNQPTYGGTIFANDQTQVYGSTSSDGDRTTLDNVGTSQNCNAVTSGTFLNLTSTSLSTGVYLMQVRNMRIKGLQYGVALQASGQGFVNGNIFDNVTCTATKFCLNLNAVGGPISGNQFLNFNHEELPGSATRGIALTSDGSANSAIQNNYFLGQIWDTTTWGNLSASATVMNGNKLELTASGTCSGNCGFSNTDTNYNAITNYRFAPSAAAYSWGSYQGFWFLTHSANGLRLAATDINKTLHIYPNASGQLQIDGISVGTGAIIDPSGSGTIKAGSGSGTLQGANLYGGSGNTVAIPTPASPGQTLATVGNAHTLVGTATLVSGTTTVSNAAACTPSATCMYSFTNCGVNASTAIGTLTLGTVSAGVSFIINSLSSGAAVVTGDASKVCYEIN